ncbi:MAG: hypothetical protein ACKPEZ_15050, partial [Planktothrix sp.]
GNQQSFFAHANVGLKSPDIAQVFNNPRYDYARWQVQIPVKEMFPSLSLTSGNTTIKAWVYNPDEHQFIQLKEEVKIMVKPD